MTNPNNCETCDYKKLNGNREGWCYMFKDELTEPCIWHSKPLDDDFDRILRDNLWDLYEK